MDGRQRGGKESSLELGRGEIDALFEQVVEEAAEFGGIRLLSLLIVSNGTGLEEEGQHGTDVIRAGTRWRGGG